jgi:hypothetical protein
MVGFSGNGTGWQFPRSYATTDSTSHGRVCEFKIGINAPEQKSATAHVSSTNKLLREKKLLIEDREQHVSIFRAWDAAQQNRLTALPERVSDGFRVTLERYAELLRRMIDSVSERPARSSRLTRVEGVRRPRFVVMMKMPLLSFFGPLANVSA